MLFGLTTKEMVIGSIAIAGATNSVINTVKTHNLKKRVSVIETDTAKMYQNIMYKISAIPGANVNPANQ